jgi:hypothetical protein
LPAGCTAIATSLNPSLNWAIVWLAAVAAAKIQKNLCAIAANRLC